MTPSPAPHVRHPNRRPETAALFEPYLYLRSPHEADTSLPRLPNATGLPASVAGAGACRPTLLDWVAVAGFLTYGLGLPAILAWYLP